MKRFFVRPLCYLAPGLMLKLAYHQLTRPQVHKLRPHELEVLATAQQRTFAFKSHTIQLYEWPGGPRSVLLIHGWEGQAGNFADLIEQLRAAKYTIYAFDAPSHGLSSRGPTSLFEFGELVEVLLEKFPTQCLVSHSFGGVPTTYALAQAPELSIERYVLLTTPDRFLDRVDFISQQVGITENVKQQLIQRMEVEIRQRSMAEHAADLNVSRFVKAIQLDGVLILHDKDDRVISIEQSRNVQRHWRNCQLEEVEGTGHFRILRTPSVIQRVVEFLG